MGLITLSLKGDQLLWISDSMINKGYYLNGLARGIFVKIEWFSVLIFVKLDYIIAVNGEIYPIEVKASHSGSMQSMFLFLKEKNRNIGILIKENINF